MTMQKLSPGHYRQIAGSDLGFEVYLYENREFNRRTNLFRRVRFWSFRAGEHSAAGYGTKREAEEAARRFIAQRVAA